MIKRFLIILKSLCHVDYWKKYEAKKTREFTITIVILLLILMLNCWYVDATISNKSVGTELDVKLEKLVERFGEHIRF